MRSIFVQSIIIKLPIFSFLPCKFVIDDRLKSAFFQIIIDFFLFLPYHFLELMLLPNIYSLQKAGAARGKISLILFDERPKCAFSIYFIFCIVVSLEQFFLRFHALVIKMLPNRFGNLLSIYVLKGRSGKTSICWLWHRLFWTPTVLMSIIFISTIESWLFLRNIVICHDFLIGFEVLLLIKVHY